MKEYFVVWEVYSEDWKLKEKGYDFLIVLDNQSLMQVVDEFCSNSAEARDIKEKLFIVSSLQPI